MTEKRRQTEYYEKTLDGRVNPNLGFACDLLDSDHMKVAIDCGCGAGRNTAFLLQRGFTVHAFDLNEEAINACRERFNATDRVVLSRASFETFDYPRASLVLASASLFFCPAEVFDDAWKRIVASIDQGGVFVGTFLGPNDTWARTIEEPTAFGTVLPLSEAEVRALFTGFDIVRWEERDEDGQTALGDEKHWHLFSVVARKKGSTH